MNALPGWEQIKNFPLFLMLTIMEILPPKHCLRKPQILQAEKFTVSDTILIIQKKDFCLPDNMEEKQTGI